MPDVGLVDVVLQGQKGGNWAGNWNYLGLG